MLWKLVRCWEYTDPAPPPVAGGTGLYRVAIRSDASPFSLKRCHDHILRPDKYRPPYIFLPVRLPVHR